MEVVITYKRPQSNIKFHNSKIVTSNSENEILSKFFKIKPLKKAEMLYRAS